ncbi:MAG: signal recognition particle receptor subunit alpha, partial [Acidobacteriota bacterium]
MKMLGRLQAGLARTRAGLAGRLGKLLRPGETRRLEDLLDQLEETLIEADVGPATAAELIAQIRNSPARDRRVTDVADLGRTLAGAIASLEGVDTAATDQASAPAKPRVVFLVGVNGGGKTTTAAKMAALYSGRGQKGLLVAADTFRAGAIDQLRVWSERIGVDLICHRDGADPSAVLFDGLKAAVARRSDFVVVDTAGRLHTKTPLMKELEKI